MIKFVEKPRVIEAIQWTGENKAEIMREFPDVTTNTDGSIWAPFEDGFELPVMLNYWLVKDLDGRCHGPICPLKFVTLYKELS